MNSTLISRINFANLRLESHMIFICPECGAEHESQQDWRRHLNQEHDYLHKTVADLNFREISELHHECLTCHKWVANANQAIALLQYHRFLHLQPYNRIYRCRHCQGSFSRKRALCEHLYRFHSRQLAISRKEKLSCMEDKALKNPRENPEFYLRFQCPQCGETIGYFHQWLKHLETAHSSTSKNLNMYQVKAKSNYCMECKKLFHTTDKAKLQRHRFTHLPYQLYFKCAFCMVKKTHKSEVLRHYIHAHPRNFATTRPYLEKPLEWAARISDKVDMELNMLLQRKNQRDSRAKVPVSTPVNKEKSSKASDQDSTINLEAEIKTDRTATTRQTNNEFALDQNLNDLQALLRNEPGRNKVLVANQDKNEFDDLCEHIFEEIEEKQQMSAKPINTSTNIAIKEEVKMEIDDDEDNDEQIISLEIDTVDDESEICRSPAEKRIKLEEDSDHNKLKDVELKLLTDAHMDYLCPQCGLAFPEQGVWREHVFSEHNLIDAIQQSFRVLDEKDALQCLECSQVLKDTTHSDLQRHRFKHMPFQAYLRCALCGETMSSKPKILTHLREYHSANFEHSTESIYKCHGCAKTFSTESQWQIHRQMCLEMPRTTRLYNIDENRRLLANLKKARMRIRQIASTCCE